MIKTVISGRNLAGCWLYPISLLYGIQSLKSQFCQIEGAPLNQIMPEVKQKEDLDIKSQSNT